LAFSQYKAFRQWALQEGYPYRILDKQGWPFLWRRIKRSRPLLLGFLSLLALLYIFSAFIWTVEVKPGEPSGLKSLTPEEILSVARQEGLKPGALKTTLRLRELEEAIETRLPQLAWVGIEVKGSKAEIYAVERRDWPLQDETPAHLVAAKDGLIKEMLVIKGQARVKPGEVVKKGDVLISGLLLEDKSIPLLVSAQGVVKARVWYEGEKTVEKKLKEKIPTGREAKVLFLKIGSRSVFLKGRVPFTCYQEHIRSYSLGGD